MEYFNGIPLNKWFMMLAVPPAILEMLKLKAGTTIGVAVEGHRWIIETRPRQRYALEELLAQCDASQPLSEEWLGTKRVGRELL